MVKYDTHETMMLFMKNDIQKLNEDKESFLSDEFFIDNFQLSAPDAEINIKKYEKKYNIRIVFNGKTNVGQKYIDQKNKECIQKNYNILKGKNPYAHYLITNWLSKGKTTLSKFEIGELVYSNFSDIYKDIENVISEFLDINGEIKSHLNEDQLKDLNQLIFNNFKDIFDKNINEFIKEIKKENSNRNISLSMISEEIKEIQNGIEKEDIVGYFFTNNVIKGHFEVLIITKNEIIKPINWLMPYREINDNHVGDNTLFTVDIENITIGFKGAIEVPRAQADNSSCGALGLSYLKELLMNEAEQYKKLSKIISFYNEDKKLVHFYLPSPQVLRYSQSKFFNEILSALFNEENTEIKHDNKSVTVLCLEHILKQSMSTAKLVNDIKILEENNKLLEELPEFKKQWLIHYKESIIRREMMSDKKDGKNRYLSYKAYSMLLFSKNSKDKGKADLNDTINLIDSEHIDSATEEDPYDTGNQEIANIGICNIL